MPKILVIDPDLDICHLLRKFLTKHGYTVETTPRADIGLKLIQEYQPHLVLTDFMVKDKNGYDMLKEIKTINTHLPVLVMTQCNDIRVAVNTLKMGVLDYILKPVLPQELLTTIHNAIVAASFDKSIQSDSQGTKKPGLQTATKPNNAYILGKSSASKNLMTQIDLVAPTPYSVIIYGESGAGKEAVARMIHDKSPRANMPFIAVDCGAIPRDLANSELFGHEKGAFTGAINSTEGHFEMSNGGTIFLDEVTNLPYDVQVALLRVVQERKCRRVGSNKEIHLDIRIIVASNAQLKEAVGKGKFREDLYHRFNEFSINVPPLRLRQGDIMLFAEQFLSETNSHLQKNLIGFEPDVIAFFSEYPWYGNVRELQNVIKRAALLSKGTQITMDALSFDTMHFTVIDGDKNEDSTNTKNSNSQYLSFIQPSYPPIFIKNDITNEKMPINLRETAQQVEINTIVNVLREVRYNKSKAAELLGIDRKTLYNKLKKMGSNEV